ncbi:MAG: acyl-CoA dehydrogenase family protein [Dehalococcoidia bacterium]
MDFRDSGPETAFREEVKGFIKGELPEGLARVGLPGAMFGGGGGFEGGDRGALKQWLGRLHGRGWTVPAWPREYGGAGMSVMEQFIFSEEMAMARAPRGLGGIGSGWVGPTIILYGTDEQKKDHLPKIASGEAVWCQGFSEPQAGSDLASVQTRAVRDGDDYILNGQKIWTSLAHVAHWCIVIARTDPEAPKHKGISYFLVDMKSPGVDVKPLINMAGSHDFNEVFFDNVRVPRESLLGEENRGWYISTATLDFERSSIATNVSHIIAVDELVKHFSAEGLKPGGRYELADRKIEAEVGRLMSYQVISMQNRGLVPNKEASIAKLYSSELDVRIWNTGVKLLGLHGQLLKGSKHAPFEGSIPRSHMYATTSPVGGGTSEIQRNIIAMRGLGMPRD